MASTVDIANLGLIKLGSKPIMSLSDNNEGARVINTIYEMVRKSELRKRNWNFAIKRQQLAALAAVPSWGFGTQYQLPTDFLRMVQVNDVFVVPSAVDYRDGDDSAYAIEGQQILADFQSPLKIRYISDITDPGQFDALFTEAFATKLALVGCERITQSNTKKADLLNDYNMCIRSAVLTNAIEKPPQGIPDDSWIMSRL